jgi:excisionase family DNA binding protein
MRHAGQEPRGERRSIRPGGGRGQSLPGKERTSYASPFYCVALFFCPERGTGGSRLDVEHREEILTPDELAEFLRCSRTYARDLLTHGEIPSFKLGKLRRVRRSDAERFVAERLTSGHEG